MLGVGGKSPGLMSGGGGVSIGRSKGVPGTCTPTGVQILSISCSFWGKIGQIIAFHIHLWNWCPYLEEFLDLPLDRSLGLISRGKGDRSLGLMSGGEGVPYHVTYPMMYLMLPTYSPYGQTDTCENIPVPKLSLRAVIKPNPLRF